LHRFIPKIKINFCTRYSIHPL